LITSFFNLTERKKEEKLNQTEEERREAKTKRDKRREINHINCFKWVER
jgi:hypothetical protein